MKKILICLLLSGGIFGCSANKTAAEAEMRSSMQKWVAVMSSYARQIQFAKTAKETAKAIVDCVDASKLLVAEMLVIDKKYPLSESELNLIMTDKLKKETEEFQNAAQTFRDSVDAARIKYSSDNEGSFLINSAYSNFLTLGSVR